ncbi:unnamed protein product [Closterium sp. NIES-54]
MVTTTTPRGHRVSICTCTWTGRHLATFTRRPGSSLYTLATEPPQIALPAQGPAPSSVSQVDPLRGTVPVEVAVDLGAASRCAEPERAEPRGAEPAGAEPRGAESEDAGSRGAEPGGAETGGTERAVAERGGAEPEGAEPGGAEYEGAGSGGAEPRGIASSLGPATARAGDSATGGTGAGGSGATSLGGAGVLVGAGGSGGAGAACPGGACTRGTGAAGVGGAGGTGAGGAGGGDPGAGGTGAGGAGAGDPGDGGAGAVDPGAGGAGTKGAASGGTGAAGIGAGDPGAGDTGARGAGPGGAGAARVGARDTGRPRPYFVPLLQQPASPLPAPSPCTEQTGGLTEHREPVSHPSSPVRAVCTGRRIPCQRPPPIPGMHHMALRPSSVISDPSFESAAASALVAKLVDFVVASRLNYAASLVAESESDYPPCVGGECALGTGVLEDRQEEFECPVAVVPHLVAMLLAPKGDLDVPDIPTPRSYAEAIMGPYSSQWQTAMDADMASSKSTGTYVDAFPPPGANIVDGMWIFMVKRPPGSPPVFKDRYVARGFSQRQGVDFFQTFSPTPKMTTLQVLLHVAAQRDYELHSLDFSTPFLQGSLHEEIWLRRPPGFTGSFPAVYIDDLVFATAHTEALALVKSKLQKRHTCTDLGELRSYLSLQISWDRARHTITLTQSHMVHQVLLRFGFRYSSPQSTPLPTGHSLSAPPSNESVEPSGPYPELVGCLMYLMTCTRPDLAYPLSILARYVASGRHRPEHWEAAKRVLRYLCSTSGMGLVLGGRGPVVLTGQADASWVDDLATQRSSQGYISSLGSGSVSWRSTRSSSVLSSSCEAEIYAGAMAA